MKSKNQGNKLIKKTNKVKRWFFEQLRKLINS